MNLFKVLATDLRNIKWNGHTYIFSVIFSKGDNLSVRLPVHCDPPEEGSILKRREPASLGFV